VGAPAAVLLAAAPAGCLGLVLLHRRRHLMVAAALLCAVTASGAGAVRVFSLGQGPISELAQVGAAVTVELVVGSDPRRYPASTRGAPRRSDATLLRARIDRVSARGRTTQIRTPVLVIISGPAGDDWAAFVPGHRIRASGVLGPPRAGDSVAAVLIARGPPVVIEELGAVYSAGEILRAGLREAVRDLPAEERGLLPGLVVGDVSHLPPALAEDFRATGMTHLITVSGANVAIVVGVVLYTGRWLGLGVRAGPIVAGLAMAGFVVLARAEPSVLRATAMGAVALIALALGRRRIAMPALCAAVLCLILFDPWLARSYGFALSVLATAGLLLLVPPMATSLTGRRLPVLGRALPLPIAQAVAVPIAAQLACAPVIAMLAGGISLVAIPANLLAAPAVAPATILGVLAAIAAPVSPALAQVLGTVGGLPAWWVVTIAQLGARVPGGTLGWPDGPRGGAALAGALLLLLAVAPPVARVTRRRLGVARAGALAGAVAVLLGAQLTSGAGLLPGSSWPPPRWVMVACDVGQGDALVLSAGPSQAVVIDAGPDPDAVDQCLRDLGVQRVALLMLTHQHADHVDGTPGVLRGREVAEILIGPLDEPAERATRVRRWAAEAGIPVHRVRWGEQRAVEGLRWEVLWPARVIDKGSAPNNASIVVLAQSGGLRLLLTGDAEIEAQAALVARLRPDRLGRVDVVKVAHHGSALQDPALLGQLRPRAALVSVGADNDYGHPAARTMQALTRTGAVIARTDRDGDIAVTGPADALRVVTRGR
jgi:competence protein ComEC